MSAAKQYRRQIADLVQGFGLDPLKRGELALSVAELVDDVLSTPAEQPSPASTGREPLDVEFKRLADTILQATTNGARLEALRSMAALFDSLATPAAARDLDVEAERREFEASEIAHQQARHPQEPLTTEEKEYLLRRDPQQRDTYTACGGEWEGWLRRAARSAAQGTQPESAPVSTEQAGDAQEGRHA